MKKTVILFSLLLSLHARVEAQTSIQVHLDGYVGKKAVLSFPDYLYFKAEFSESHYLSNDTFFIEVESRQIVFAELELDHYSLGLFIKPQAHYSVYLKALDPRNTLEVSQSPANEAYLNSLVNPLNKWQIPERQYTATDGILMVLQVRDQELAKLNDYQLSSSAEALLQRQIDYYFGNQLLALVRDYSGAEKAAFLNEMEVFLTSDFINNPSALPCPAYQTFLYNYPQYIREYFGWAFLGLSSEQPDGDRISIFYRTIEYYFTLYKQELSGLVLENALLRLLNSWPRYGQEIDWIDQVYQYYKQEFGQSSYLPRLKEIMQPLDELRQKPFGEDDYEVASQKIDSFKNIIRHIDQRPALICSWSLADSYSPVLLLKLSLLHDELDSMGIRQVYLFHELSMLGIYRPTENLIRQYKLNGTHFTTAYDNLKRSGSRLKNYFSTTAQLPILYFLSKTGKLQQLDLNTLQTEAEFLELLKRQL